MDNEKDFNFQKAGLVVIVVVLLLALSIVAYNFMDFNRRGPLGEPRMIDSFLDGGRSPLVNASYTGTEVYFEIDADAVIEKATLSVAGALPPSKIGSEIGRAPIDVAAADYNRDGFTDVAAINYNDNTVSVRFNRLGEGFERSGTYPVAKAPIKIIAMDLNSDTYPDLAVLSEDVSEVTVLMNDGNGMFIGNRRSYPVDRVPSDIAAFDADGDGDIDLCVSDLSTDKLTFFMNDGSGSFTLGEQLEIGRNPSRILPMDLDKDGMMDIALYLSQGNGSYYNVERERTQRWYNTVVLLMNRGGMVFQEKPFEYRVQRGVNSMDAADLDGDGHMDIAMAHLGYNSISVLYSEGSANFRKGGSGNMDSREFRSLDPIDLKLVELDGDGHIDAIAISKSADSILVYYNMGNGSFHDFVHYYGGLSPTSFDFLDFDLDGDLDVVTSDWRGKDGGIGGNGTISIIRNLRNGIFGTYRQYVTGNSPRGIFTYDLDGDGDKDIATANYFGSTISILKNDGLGLFSSKQDYPIGLEPYMVVMGDLNNDGYIDAASADEANFRIILLESDKNGGFTTDRYLIDIQAYPFSLRIDDVNGDGFPDLYTSNYAQNTTTILINDGSGNFETMFSDFITIDLGNRMPYDALMKDVNGDGLKDLITVNRGDDLDPTNTISIFLNEGDLKFKDHATYSVGRQPTAGLVIDLDNDGDLDIATSDAADDTVTVLLNDGYGNFERLGTYPVGDRPQFLTSIDLDHDGWIDIVVSNSESNDLHILRNNNGRSFSKFSDMWIGAFPYMISVDDLNNDGRHEIVLTSVNTARAVVQGCFYYPSDVRIDVGSDDNFEMDHEGSLGKEVFEIDITDAVKRYIEDHGGSGKVRVPVSVICGQQGVVRLSGLTVIYR
ncbi:MAG: VCBS repeat-containing protein [Candidatus Thermoplasmatota archaeon]|nr:VCBS repeat-containing protein [Candidatus Thermoplasmatota archaeon]